MQNLLALGNEESASPVKGGIAMLQRARRNGWEEEKA
jgi:hypothetical protein